MAQNKYKFQNIKRQSVPFWSWNDKLENARLEKQVEWMKNEGFGGFFMHARSGLNTEYLSEEWFGAIKACAIKAKELGMDAWAYDENGWPSGFVGGKLLEDEKNRENYLTFKYGVFDENSLVSYDISSDNIKRLKKGDKCDNALNIYKNTSLTTVDILDDKVVDRFIAETHEKYEKYFDGKLSEYIKGFFTDEPQYYGTATPYPHLIKEYFRKNYNADILDGLGLLYCEKQGYREFRYKYYSACQQLFLHNYSEKIYNWCDARGVKLTGHYIEEFGITQQMYYCAGIMPFYEYEHIPGIDWLCRRFLTAVPVKQLVSAAAQLGKKEMLTETFALTGWDVTPTELKAIAEFQFLYGINVMCMHLLPYSELGHRKNDYPVHFSASNAWAEDVLPEFNAYFDRLSALSRGSEEDVKVAVLHPIRTAYLTYNSGESEKVGEAFKTVSEYLANEQISFHYLDETLFEKHGSVNGNSLVCGKCSYRYLIIVPETLTMGKFTERAVREFVLNGGKVLLVGEKPLYLEGEPYSYDYLKTNTSFEEIKSAQKYRLNYNGGKVRTCLKHTGQGDFLMALNIDGFETAECSLDIRGDVKLLDLYCENVRDVEKNFTLKPYESKILLVDYQGESVKDTKNETIVLPTTGYEVVTSDENYLVLDTAKISYDGINYTPSYPVPGIFEYLIKAKYNGDLYLKFEFDCNYIADDMRVIYENCQAAEFTVNGEKIVFDGSSKIDPNMITAKIADCVKIGHNEIIEKIRFYEDDIVFTALYGEGVTETLRNCLVYNTYIDTLRLSGHFGVYTKDGLKETGLKNFFTAKEFYIDKPKTVIDDLIFDGYLFFAGKIRLRKEIELDKTDVSLKITGRIHFAKLYVNGKYVGDYMFNDALDISKFAKQGKNEIEVELLTGSRNLFGPFHDKRKVESFWVGPSSFSFYGRWNNFKCDDYTSAYSFARAGIFECDGQFRVVVDY